MGRLEGKRSLESPRRRSEDIKIVLRQVGCVSGYWIDVAQDNNQCRVYVRVVINLRVP